MKLSQVYAVTVAVQCPGCEELIPEPRSGSEFWTTHEAEKSKTVACPHCHQESVLRVPQRVEIA